MKTTPPISLCLLMAILPAKALASWELTFPGSACLAEDGDDQDDVEYQDDDYAGGGSIENVGSGDVDVVCPLAREWIYPDGYPLSGTDIWLDYLDVRVYADLGDAVSCTFRACDRDGAPCALDSATQDDDYFDDLLFDDYEFITGRHMFLECTLPVGGRVFGYRWLEVES